MLTAVGVGIDLQGRGWRLSHLDIRCDGPSTGVENSGGDGALDHATIDGCARGHGFFSERGRVTVGPGVTILGNRFGIKVEDGSARHPGGRRRRPHVDSSSNQTYGVWLHGLTMAQTSADFEGRDISPSAPDQNDIATDDNGTAIELETGQLTLVVRGLHATGNGTGIKGSATTMKVRGSFLANNLLSAIPSRRPIGSTVDLGPDPGRARFRTQRSRSRAKPSASTSRAPSA